MDGPQSSHYSAFMETSARYLGLEGHVDVEIPDVSQAASVRPDQSAGYDRCRGESA